MAGTIQYASHSNFFTGMIRDVPRHLIPDGGVFDATNIVITNAGALSKRGASSTALSATTTMNATEMGSQISYNTDGKTFLYTAQVAAGVVKFASMLFAVSTQVLSTFTSAITAESISSPTTYGDSIVFPIANAGGTGSMAWCGGANLKTAGAAAVTAIPGGVSIASVNAIINVGAAAAATMSIGGFVHLYNDGTDEYTGRIVSVSSPNVTVNPAPIRSTTTAFTTAAYYPVLPQVGTKSDGSSVMSAGCAGTFASGGDTRIVLGDVKTVNAATGSISSHPNRIVWSVREASDAVAPTHNGSSALATGGVDGLVQATRMGFPALNYIDIEDIERIVGLVPIGSGNMLVLGTKSCVLLSGSLITQSAGVTNTSLGRGGLTASVRGFAQQVGCISPKSIQRTSAGVMFASTDGVYLTDGTSLVNTMLKKIANIWGQSLSGNTVFTFDTSTFGGNDVFGAGGIALGVYGSANINDSHYYISMAAGGFLCDLRAKFGWTRVQAGQLEISASANDSDQTTNRVYAITRTTSTDASTNRVIRIDPIVAPTATSTDADGTVFNSSITTRAYTEGDPAQKRRYRHTLLAYRLVGAGGSFTINAVVGLDGAGANTLIGTTATDAATSTVSRYDHQTISQSVTYIIDSVGSPTEFSLYEVTNGFNQLRPGRTSS